MPLHPLHAPAPPCMCRTEDHTTLKAAKDCTPPDYAQRPDGKVTFDLNASLYRSGARRPPTHTNILYIYLQKVMKYNTVFVCAGV